MPGPPQKPQDTPIANRNQAIATLISAALIIVTLAVFSPVIRNEFVNYDDPDYVTANAHVQGGFTWPNIQWAFSTGPGHASNWHPVTWLSHMLDYKLFKENAGAHHLMNAALHAVNAMFLFLLWWRMTGFIWRSAFVAALFAWHPLHVESVAWASERKDVLSAFFFFLTLLAYVRYADRSKVQSPKSKVGEPVFNVQYSVFSHRWVYYGLAITFYALGLMSKPMLVTTPFVMLLLDWWPLGRIAEWEARSAEWQTAQDRQLRTPHSAVRASMWLVLEKVPFFLLSWASSVMTFQAQREGGAVSTSISFWPRVLNATVAYALYIRNMFIPNELAVLYPHPGHWPTNYLIAAAILLIALFAIVAVFSWKRPWLAVGWLWYLGMLVPAIGAVVQVGIQCMADRYTYLPLIGLFVMITWTVAELWRSYQIRSSKSEIRSSKGAQKGASSDDEREAIWQAVVAAATAIVLLGCIVGTIHQIAYWRNSETLFEHTARVTRNNYLAYNNLGYYLSNRGKIQEAIENYRKALEINPQYEDAYNNLGFALAAQKKHNEAIAHYKAALNIRPNHTEVHNNLGNALADLGRVDEAIEQYRIVLKQNPEHADAHNNLGIALAMKGQFDEAISNFVAAIKYKKNYASAHSNLGNALAVQHKIPEAIREYQECLKLNPNDPQAHNNLGNALAEMGQLPEAIQHYERAIELNKDNPEAHFNVGMALKRLGRIEDASNHFQEAIRLKPDYAEPKKQLEATGQKP